MDNITIVIPVYNEEDILVENSKKLIHFLDTLFFKYEVIIIDNGSTDETTRKGKELEREFSDKIRFLSTRQKGVGLAFKKAVEVSKYDKILSLDIDLSAELDFVPMCHELLDNYDIVIGSKKAGTQTRPLLRRVASSTFIFLTRVLLGLDITDYSISTKGYTKNKIMGMISDIDSGTFYVIKILYFASIRGYKIIQVPVKCVDTRKSKFNLIHESLYRLKYLLSLWSRERIMNNRWI